MQQRHHRPTLVNGLTDVNGSSLAQRLPESDKVVPDSFADWLARPADTITACSEPEPAIFMRLMNKCCEQNSARPPLNSRPL